MLQKAFIKSLLDHKHEFTVLLAGNGISWVTSYFIPIVSALSISVTCITAIIIMRREYKKMKEQAHKKEG